MSENIIKNNEEIIAETQEWLEKAVIGLNLCPFAKAVHVKKQRSEERRVGKECRL